MGVDKILGNVRDVVGTIEDTVLNSKLVDVQKAHFEQIVSTWAPTHTPERRRFMKRAAEAAAAAFIVQYVGADSAEAAERPGSPVTEFNGKRYGGWQAYLMGQDPVFGPPISIYPGTNKANDFANHVRYLHVRNIKWGGTDLAVPSGVPIVPALEGVARAGKGGFGGIGVLVEHQRDEEFGYDRVTDYQHLSRHSENIVTTGLKDWGDTIRRNSVSLTSVIGYSGRSGTKWPHLHLTYLEKTWDGGKWNPQAPGVDPMTKGNIPGKLAYYDGAAESIEALDGAERRHIINGIRYDIRTRSDELELSAEDLAEFRSVSMQSDSSALQRYFKERVFSKDPSSGTYRHLPGSEMYRMAIELVRQPNADVVLMVPLISPLVVDRYQKANPGIAL